MITRIVKLTFKEENIETFKIIFEQSKSLIRASEGCWHLELLNDVDNPHIFFTHSIWRDEDALNLYRQSDLFKTTWAKTKILFLAKAEAYSTHIISQTDVTG